MAVMQQQTEGWEGEVTKLNTYLGQPFISFPLFRLLHQLSLQNYLLALQKFQFVARFLVKVVNDGEEAKADIGARGSGATVFLHFHAEGRAHD